MDDIFAQKLKTFSNPKLSQKDQEELCTYHHKLIIQQVIPAYQELVSGLKTLRGSGKNAADWHISRVVAHIISTFFRARPVPMYL